MAQSATVTSFEGLHRGETAAVVETTLLDLVQTLGELTDDDRQVVEAVIELLRTGRVRLTGNFRGQRLAEA
jgi:hypothetical protein